jgi:hypothetical protein
MHKRARELADEDKQLKTQDTVLREKRSRVDVLSRQLVKDALERTKTLAAAGRIDASVVLLAYMATTSGTEVYRDHDGALVLCLEVSRYDYECKGTIQFLPSGKILLQNVGYFDALTNPVELLTLNLWTHGFPIAMPTDTVKYTRQEALVHLCVCLDQAESAARVPVLAEFLPVADLPELVDAYAGPVSHQFPASTLQFMYRNGTCV